MVAKDFRALAIQRREGVRAHRRDLSDLANVLGRKDEAFGIDVPGVDEPVSLLRAAARIGAVHEATLVVHEAVQVTSRSSETLAKRVAAHVQQLGADHVADLEDRAEDVSRCPRSRQSSMPVVQVIRASSTRRRTSTGTVRSSGGSRSGM